MFQKPPCEAYTPPHIDIEGHQLNAVEHFTYLGSVISNDATTAKDVDNRIAKAGSSFGRLQKRVWQIDHSLRLTTKIKVYRTAVLTPLLYGAETWVLNRKQLSCWSDFTRDACYPSWASSGRLCPNEEVLEKANTTGIEFMLLLRQLRWDRVGHVSRMDNSRMSRTN